MKNVIVMSFNFLNPTFVPQITQSSIIKNIFNDLTS